MSWEDWSAWNADEDQAMRKSFRWSTIESNWREEALRTNLWLIPAIESVAAVALFAATLTIDEAAFHGRLRLPSWVISGSPDAAREILSSLAGAVLIRQLDTLSKVMTVAPPGRAQVLLDQAGMIEGVSERTVPEPADRADATARYQELLALHAKATRPA